MEATETELDERHTVATGDEHVPERAGGRGRAEDYGENPDAGGENPRLQAHTPAISCS